jgi:hypothetical protein
VINDLDEMMRHQNGKRQEMQAFDRFRQALVVGCRPAKPGPPGKTGFDFPAAGQQHKAPFDIWQFHHCQPNPMFGSRLFSGLAGVSLIS